MHAPTTEPRKDLRVLIIDDNQDFAENLTEILEVEGATVRHADCVARSHDELAQFQPNVAFVDLRLPDGSGEDLLLEMSRSVPDCLCIVLTGNASIQSAIMAVERGAFGFLIKDMPVEAVIASYRRAGERLALEDQARLLEARLAHQEQLAMIGQMAATLAHEIRNPLTGIRQALEVILEATGEPPGMEGIKVSMLERLKRLHELVDDLLRFARPVTVEKRSVDVQELVDQVIHEVERDSQTYGAKFEIQIDDSVRRWPVDSNHFHLLLRNLIENGVLAMEKSELRVLDIRAQRVSGPLPFSLSIRDSGTGLAPGVALEIFKPFFTTRTRGTGLGLALAKRIAEEHGGTITAKNHPAGGAEFTIRLPELNR